jgi:hypothetical protein
MTNKTWGIILGVVAVVLFAGGMAAGYFAFRCETDGRVIIQTKYVQGPTVYIRDGSSKECGNLEIDGDMIAGNKLHTTCGDKCKNTFRDFDMGIIAKQKNFHVLQLGYGPLYDIGTKQFRHSVDAMYLYSWKYFSLGAGALAVFDKTQLYDIGPRVALQFRIPSK